MTPLFNKMNLGDIREIIVANIPKSFEPELKALADTVILRDAKPASQIQFGLAFVQTLQDVKDIARNWIPKASTDPVIWLAYPKGSSKTMKCEFNRDTGWASIMDLGFDTVRIISIDSDWSALRFRRIEFIKRAD